MQVVQFIADSASAALGQIHRQLGPEAVVLSVRRLPAQGVARLWPGAARIEILAGVPETDAPSAPFRELPMGLDDRLSGISTPHWKSVEWLASAGLLPEHADRLQSRLDALHSNPPETLDEEWNLARNALTSFWPAPVPAAKAPSAHVFIGSPGSGKSTALCKWLTLAVLTEERSAAVWRLDSNVANTAEFLSVHCEMLSTPVERMWSGRPTSDDLLFFDLPGTEVDDSQALGALRNQLAALPPHQLHLVLNAAYETSALLAQLRAFAPFKPADLIFTHLDEETRRIKLWNLVFGTNCSIRFLGAGQKIPGEFRAAVPELLFPLGIQP